MDTIIDITPKLSKETSDLVLKIDAYETNIIITNNIDYERVGDELKQIKSIFNALDTKRKKATMPIDNAKKEIMNWFRRPLERLETAESKRKRAMLTYQQEQERKRREEEARLQEKARKEAERLAARAEKAEANGNIEKAETLRQEAQEKEMLTPVVASPVEKVAGISTKKVWKFEIVNEDLIPREYMIADEARIGKVVRATAGTLTIPGVRIYAEDVLAARS